MAGPPVRSRRDEYADLTRDAVLDAARSLFADKGFFQTKVEEIARLSRVSPATVYAQCGGKQGLLRSLMDNWTSTRSPAAERTLDDALAGADALAIMKALANAYLQATVEWADVIRVVIDVAPHDEESKAVLATAQKRHNRILLAICRRLEELGALREGVDARQASRIITYYYGIDGLQRTRDVLGWSLDRSNAWLLTQTTNAVLRSPDAS